MTSYLGFYANWDFSLLKSGLLGFHITVLVILTLISFLLLVWRRASPFMARILAILKHSHVMLNISQSERGKKLLGMLEKFLVECRDAGVEDVYLILRRYLMRKDTENTCGGLAR